MDVPGILMTRNPKPSNGHDADQAQVTLDSIADAIVRSDKVGNVTYLNAAAEAMTGWSRAEANGQPVGEVVKVVDGSTARYRTERAHRVGGEQRPYSARRRRIRHRGFHGSDPRPRRARNRRGHRLS
jgi:PAS domain-containing protein